ncbi:mitochondrial ribosomal protein L31 [Kockovaella imperatae]|uniref:Large ribosomal subunit protein mL60 n=1 Tax=Kockovaella imperatae TaxID=4999 RepID=A0A1Y1URB1_9TREE|nr:mitochondrial ribosomal protein L31 [Kockovaella imperatae]ORX40580.1 mitochondrial ribosomal protein L31 [Kockovaella imperatae]
MLGAFRSSQVALGGLLWKRSWRMSTTQKQGQRDRLRRVDNVIACVAESNVKFRALDKALALPTEHEMLPKDKYTTFSHKGRKFRKGQHHVPKWTRLTMRTNPKGF